MGKKEHVDSRVFDEWECRVLDTIRTRIDRLKSKDKNPRKKHVLSDKTCKRYLEDFHKCYVLVPADKAGNNVLVVCKKYYLDVMLKELDICNGNSPQTYVSCSAYSEEIVLKHEEFMTRQNVKIPDEMRQLATLYWLPKMHKNPIGSRFIAASNKIFNVLPNLYLNY